MATFLTRLARSPAPRPDAVDPRVLMRRAPLVARLARVRAGERRVVALGVALELATLAGALVVLQAAMRGAAFVPLRAAIEGVGLGGLPALALIAGALLLAAGTAAAAPSR